MHGAKLAPTLCLALKTLGKFCSNLIAQSIRNDDPNTLSAAIRGLNVAQIKINLTRNTFHISLQAQCIARRACPTARKLLKKPAFIQSFQRLKAGPEVFIELVLPRSKGTGELCHQLTVPSVHAIEIAGIRTPKGQSPHARKTFYMVAIKTLHMSCSRNATIIAGKFLIPERSATRGDDRQNLISSIHRQTHPLKQHAQNGGIDAGKDVGSCNTVKTNVSKHLSKLKLALNRRCHTQQQ